MYVSWNWFIFVSNLLDWSLMGVAEQSRLKQDEDNIDLLLYITWVFEKFALHRIIIYKKIYCNPIYIKNSKQNQTIIKRKIQMFW